MACCYAPPPPVVHTKCSMPIVQRASAVCAALDHLKRLVDISPDMAH